MKNIKNLIEQTPNDNCVLNVTRQIGTTTALCQYAIDMVMKGKSVVYHTNNNTAQKDVYQKLVNIAQEKSYEFDFPDEGSRTLCIVNNNSDAEIKIVYGDCKSSLVGLKFIYIVDNADFFDDWQMYLGMTTIECTKVIIASCPSRFTGHWSLFKKLCVKDQPMWKVFNLKHEYDDKFRQSMSSESYDMECNNYESFFDTAKKIYENIGDLLFIENNPFYKRIDIDK